MLPLGDSFTGLCLADPQQPAEAPEAALPFCNMGYARGECSRFPIGPGPDAVRFTISRDEGHALQIYYVLERGHHPFAHGQLTYQISSQQIDVPPGDPALRAEADAYIGSYIRRKHADSQAKIAVDDR